MSQRLNFSVDFGNAADSKTGKNDHDAQLTFVVLGNFNRDQDAQRQPGESNITLHKTDLDNFESLLSRMNPTLEIDLAGVSKPLHLSFKTLDDFHPDQLYQQLSMLDLEPPPIEHTSQTNQDQRSPESSESDQQTLSRLLGDGALSTAPGNRPAARGKSALIESVVGRLVNDSLLSDSQENSDRNQEKPDSHQGIAKLLRTLLHHPAFQALESRWRGLDWLLRNIESEEVDGVYLLNLGDAAWNSYTRQDLDITQTELFGALQQRFCDQGSSAQKLLLICDKQIAPSSEGITLLHHLGQLAESLDAHLIAGADACFISADESNSDDLVAWNSIKDSLPGKRISLVLPRVLLRLPYGAQYDPVDAFDFEELDQQWSASDLLWGCPAYALAIILAAYHRPNSQTAIPSLTDCPAFAYSEEGEARLQPCTEHIFLEKELNGILQLGLVPLIGSRRTNIVKLPWQPQL